MPLYHFHLKNNDELNHCCAIMRAKTLKKAIELTNSEPYRAIILGNSRYFNLLYIDKDKPITRLPRCNLMHKGENEGKICCGPSKLYIDYDEGILGLCVINPNEDYLTRGGCPLSKILYHACNPRFPGFPAGSIKRTVDIKGVSYTYVDLSHLKP